MRTKIVYVLVSQESDYYYEMFLLSHYSLRLHHPKGDAEVVLVMDTDTHQRLVDKNAPVLADVTPVVVSIPEEYTIMQRSRYLKTSLRQRIEGDFLFLDTDTLVCEKLDDTDSFDVDIAMVADLHCLHETGLSMIERCKQAGFSQSENYHYFNGGVFFCRQKPSTELFFRKWHELWKQSLQRGVYYDQPALWATDYKMGAPIKEISGIWNSQTLIPAYTAYISNTKILHYFVSINHSILQKYLFEHIKTKGAISGSTAQIARHPRTTGISVFSGSMNKERTLEYLFSDLLHVYDYTPPLYRLLVLVSRILVKPIRFLSVLKQRLWTNQN